MTASPVIRPFFDETTSTVSYLVADPETRRCAVVDPVLDYDPRAARTRTASAEAIVAEIESGRLELEWILETHVHADHVSAADWLKARLGGAVAISRRVAKVQATFGPLFGAEPGFATDGSQFDHLFADGERFRIGSLEAAVLATPGHTPACVTYVVGEAAFVGDTLFMPDLGSARCDFPGGDAVTMWHSIRRILDLPPETRLYVCHDYPPPGRGPAFVATVAEHRRRNIHVHDGVTEAEYVALRTGRDRKLDLPALMLPAVQLNMRAGRPPPPEADARRYLKLPLNLF